MVEYGKVEARAETVLIVGAGPSASLIDWQTFRLPHVHIIAVAQMAKYLPDFDSWITVDPEVTNRAIMANKPRKDAVYYAAVPDDYGTPDPAIYWHKGPSEIDIVYLRRLTRHRSPAKSVPRLAEDAQYIHSGNSGYGALGLAYHMQPKKIGLIGIDGYGGYAFETGRPTGYMDHLAWLFRTALIQLEEREIKVVNASPRSVIDCFPKMDIVGFLDWLSEGV